MESSTSEDKQGLVQWMFFAIALNPNTAPFATVAVEQREAADRQMAQLLERLLTESCVAEAKKAVQYEGEAAVKQSFGLLGQVATAEIFNNPQCQRGRREVCRVPGRREAGKHLEAGGNLKVKVSQASKYTFREQPHFP